MRFSLLSLFLLAVGGSAAEGQFPRPPRPVNVGWRDTVAHTPGFVTVAPGVRIHYLDFGGTGEPLVLLAGIGNNAHAYDDFARFFTDRFRVISITRRGFGESSHPRSGYELARLTRDIRAVMDSLKLGRVYLAGHSFAGSEMTHFVRTNPGRVIKMVYLDGAFDGVAFDSVAGELQRAYERSLRASAPTPGWPVRAPLRTADTLTAEAYVSYVHRTRGVKIPESDIRIRMSYDGVIEEEAPPYVAIATSEGAGRPDWPTLPVPALAVFAFYERLDQMEPWAREQRQHTRDVNAALARNRPLYEFLVKDFLRAPNSKAVTIWGGHHWIFISHRDQVVHAMREFLLER